MSASKGLDLNCFNKQIQLALSLLVCLQLLQTLLESSVRIIECQIWLIQVLQLFAEWQGPSYHFSSIINNRLTIIQVLIKFEFYLPVFLSELNYYILCLSHMFSVLSFTSGG
jgi:hypothetical protein